jgi:HTH-type transcriptional regulator/antitoxin HigA
MSQKEFAIRMNLSQKHVSNLINGTVQLTVDVANRLEMVLGVSAQFWNNLESRYREKLVKVAAENKMAKEIEIVKKLPYQQMAKLGWIHPTRNYEERVIHSRKFFEIVDLSLLENNLLIPQIACRRLSENEKADYALLAWSVQVKKEARLIETKNFSKMKFQAALAPIRAMTLKSPSDFQPKLQRLLADCGVALVFLPHLESSFLHGATFVDGKKIVVGLTTRGKAADKFWFSLFHELAHILNNHLDIDRDVEFAEQEADRIASDLLLPPEDLQEFISKKDFSQESILSFAQTCGVAPGIVVGRLQKEGRIPYSVMNHLKEQYELT